MSTFDEGIMPPSYKVGLPAEIHIWKNLTDKELYILRDTDDDTIPTWCRWREGQAIKDCGAEYVTKEGRGEDGRCNQPS